jgi:ribonuclease HI
MKYVTIATDISSDEVNKITTWACYIRYDGGAIKRVGQFKEFHKSSSAAETYALINALTIAKNSIPDWNESRVIIHNEVEHVLTPITSKAGNIRKRDLDRAIKIRTLALPILKEAKDWERRKIKAHFSGWKESDNPAKYAINRWCDIESRALMRELRKEKKMNLIFGPKKA